MKKCIAIAAVGLQAQAIRQVVGDQVLIGLLRKVHALRHHVTSGAGQLVYLIAAEDGDAHGDQPEYDGHEEKSRDQHELHVYVAFFVVFVPHGLKSSHCGHIEYPYGHTGGEGLVIGGQPVSGNDSITSDELALIEMGLPLLRIPIGV